MELECIVDFRGTADWRRMKSRQYPEDTRNEAAAITLDKLAEEASELEGSELHKQLYDLWENEPDDALRWASFNEVISEQLRWVGFYCFPKSARSFLEGLLETMRR